MSPSFGAGHLEGPLEETPLPWQVVLEVGSSLISRDSHFLSVNTEHLGQIIFCVQPSRKEVCFLLCSLGVQTQWDQDPVVPCSLLYQVFSEKNKDSPTSGSLKSESYVELPLRSALSVNYVFKALSACHQKFSTETQT